MAGQPGFYVYILACENGAYYSGWTTDPARRLKTHNSGKGARYTRMNGPSRLVYLEKLPNRKSAMQREQHGGVRPRNALREIEYGNAVESALDRH